jgi:hypothetical protein
MSIQEILKSQYHASLAMLVDAIDSCPAAVWSSDDYVNPTWQVAYHVVFYTDFYLQPSETAFVPWQHHRQGHQRLGGGPDAAASRVPYSQAEVVSYARRCRGSVDAAVDRLDLQSPESGFPWYPISKLEHQLVNLRHLQHHTGQLTERVRQTAGRGVRWIGHGTRSDPA